MEIINQKAKPTLNNFRSKIYSTKFHWYGKRDCMKCFLYRTRSFQYSVIYITIIFLKNIEEYSRDFVLGITDFPMTESDSGFLTKNFLYNYLSYNAHHRAWSSIVWKLIHYWNDKYKIWSILTQLSLLRPSDDIFKSVQSWNKTYMNIFIRM